MKSFKQFINEDTPPPPPPPPPSTPSGKPPVNPYDKDDPG